MNTASFLYMIPNASLSLSIESDILHTHFSFYLKTHVSTTMSFHSCLSLSLNQRTASPLAPRKRDTTQCMWWISQTKALSIYKTLRLLAPTFFDTQRRGGLSLTQCKKQKKATLYLRAFVLFSREDEGVVVVFVFKARFFFTRRGEWRILDTLFWVVIVVANPFAHILIRLIRVTKFSQSTHFYYLYTLALFFFKKRCFAHPSIDEESCASFTTQWLS